MSEVLDTTCELIRAQPTEYNPEGLYRAAAILRETLTAAPGIGVKEFEHNGKPSLLAYVGDVCPTEFDVLLSGHFDVVPAGPEQFAPTVRDGRLYGRGADDALAIAAGMAITLRKVARKGTGVLLTGDEEVLGRDGVGHLTTTGQVSAKFVVVGESTPPATICNEYKGLAQADITFSGTPAHESRPWLGGNAVSSLLRAGSRILKTYPEPTKPAWETTVTPVLIGTSNKTRNRIPGDAYLAVSSRHIPGDSSFSDEESFRAHIESLIGNENPHVEVVGFGNPVSVSVDNPFVLQLLGAIEAVHGEAQSPIRREGSCDGRYFPVGVVYGMSGGNIHSDGEYLDLASVEPYIQTLRHFLGNLVVA